MACDPNYGAVVLLTPLQGDILDLSPVGNVGALSGSATLPSTGGPFGGAAGYLDFASTTSSATDLVEYPITPGSPLDVLAGTGDATIEGWFILPSGASQNNGFCIIDFGGDGSPTSGLALPLQVQPANLSIVPEVPGYSGLGSSGVTVSLDTWHHFAIVRMTGGTDTRLYLDGVQVGGIATNWLNYPTVTGCRVNYGRNTATFGTSGSAPGGVADVRVSNIAQYTGPFTPPTADFPTMACTGTTVPDVVGDDVATATAALNVATLVLGTNTQVVSALPAGTVISQNPAAGSAATAGDAVDITTSQGIAVPDVRNTSVDTVAPAILAAAGFVLGVVTFSADVLIIKGNIISQFPAPGSFASPGSGVNVVVSTGRAGLFVPDIIDDTAAQADLAILNVGLVVGAVSTRSSLTVPVGEVIAQNPQGGTPVASGSIVSYVLSSGPPVPGPAFDWRVTVISQFANSPTILQLCSNMAGYVDQSTNFANFFEFVWNVDTAQGFGLDIWGAIVDVSRLLQIPTGARYVGFQDGTGPGTGTDVEPFSAGGSWYTPVSATEAYLLEDEPYRQLILTKALANIVNTTVPAFNQLLQNLFPGRGNPYVITSGVMAMEFIFDFDLTPIELAILQQSGAVPVPPGVSFTISVP